MKENENENKLLQKKKQDVEKALATVENTTFTAYGDMKALIAYCTPIAASDFSPFSSPEDVAAALLWAHEKDISAIDALSHLFILNGRVSPDSYLIGALLQKTASVTFSIKVTKVGKREYREDCRPLYNYSYRASTFSQDDIDLEPEKFYVTTMDMIKNKHKLVLKAQEEGKIPVVKKEKPYDYRTVIIFERMIRLPDGSFKVITEEGEFTYSDAAAADLVNRDTYKKYLKDMLYNRAFTRGAKRIGKDLIFTSREATEMMDVYDIPYSIEKEVEGTFIEIEENEN